MPRPGWLAAFQPQAPSLWRKRNTPKRIQTHHTDVKTSSLLPESNICTERLAETKAKKDKPNTALFKTCELVLQPRTIIPCHIQTTQNRKPPTNATSRSSQGVSRKVGTVGVLLQMPTFKFPSSQRISSLMFGGQVASFPV